VIGDMKPIKENAILLLVANPVDVLTYFAHSYSGLPAKQVIGSGTFLDSARLRGKLSGEIGVAASSIDAWVLGEHGESQIVSLPQDVLTS
jgi:L-lactate dehydrogenase